MKPLWRMLAVFSLAWVGLAQASVAPDELVKTTSERVLGELTQNRAKFEGDKQALFALVDEIVLPHFDFRLMSRFVLGRHWRDASEAQQERFVEEFKALLVRTYATALFEYTGQEIKYKPFRSGSDATKAIVKTEIIPSSGPKIPLDYSLSKGDDGRWRVFDIRIDGISLVTNYRSSYGQVISTKGIDSLISSISEKNAAQ